MKWALAKVVPSAHGDSVGRQGECAAAFSNSVGYEDGVYFDALMRMFEQALKLSVTLPVDQRDVLLDRLDDVRRISHDFGYGLGDGMDVLFTSYGVDD